MLPQIAIPGNTTALKKCQRSNFLCDCSDSNSCGHGVMSRRHFLQGAVLGSLYSLTPAWAKEATPRFVNDFWIKPRILKLRHSSGESLEIVYWSDGELIQKAYEEACWFMRDRVVQQAVYMNPVLLDISYGITGWLDYYGVHAPIWMNSAYREWVRNSRIEGAALNSEHTKGGALDIRIQGVSSLQTARFGVWLGGGGVGWYPNKNFTHIDSGRVRTWRG
jgi:uncharacterized protein YcbK (DUF882 family)